MDDNKIKYTYENNIRLLIPNLIESIKTKFKIKETPIAKVNFTHGWKINSFSCPMENNYLTKMIK